MWALRRVVVIGWALILGALVLLFINRPVSSKPLLVGATITAIIMGVILALGGHYVTLSPAQQAAVEHWQTDRPEDESRRPTEAAEIAIKAVDDTSRVNDAGRRAMNDYLASKTAPEPEASPEPPAVTTTPLNPTEAWLSGELARGAEYRVQRNIDKALAQYRAILAFSYWTYPPGSRGYQRYVAEAHGRIGASLHYRNQVTAAMPHYLREVAIRTSAGNDIPLDEANRLQEAYQGLNRIYTGQKNHGRALSLNQEALAAAIGYHNEHNDDASSDVDTHLLVIRAYALVVRTFRELGHRTEAIRYTDACLIHAFKVGNVQPKLKQRLWSACVKGR